MSESDSKMVTFIQYDIPPLKDGEYTVSVDHAVKVAKPTSPPTSDTDSFSNSIQFAVAGERFSFDPDELFSSFAPNLANGEYAGVLPHVVFKRRTLPWERTSVESELSAPWLAVFLFNEDEAQTLNEGTGPTPQKLSAKDLIANGTTIHIAGSTVTGTGTLPDKYFSYPEINPLDYGETPDDSCLVIDVPVDLFNKIAPAAVDLPLTAHIREVDTTNSEDNTVDVLQYAVVIGNRVGLDNAKSYAFLVSLENMGDYLPAEDGTPSGKIPEGTQFVRLITYRYWSYFANTLGEKLVTLLEHLNKTQIGGQWTEGFSSLQFPFQGTIPTPFQVEAALFNQASGKLSESDAQILMTNAMQMAYVPLNHHLRHAGQTVSWYRGALAPYPVETNISLPISCPDAANRYNPQTGLFDVSYGAAWQLGQLLALQNTAFATTLYNWKKTLQKAQVIQEEQYILEQKLKDLPTMQSVLAKRQANIAPTLPAVPDLILDWIASLRLLNGVPFQFLVPDERMLPPESLRFFYLDLNWIDALVDGAFSIGRATTGELAQDAYTLAHIRPQAVVKSKTLRPNARLATDYVNQTGRITGFLLRSQIVSGWSRLNANGYSDADGENEIPKLRMSRLSDEVILCLFDGEITMAALHEPPEQLHSGVEGTPGNYTTTLRAVTGANPGEQYTSENSGGEPTSIAIDARTDNQTLKISQAAGDIMNLLNTDYKQGIANFTSAEFALEMVKGVVKVEYNKQ